MRRVDGLVAKVARASNEQSQGIGQVTTVIAQTDQVTHGNAASAEGTHRTRVGTCQSLPPLTSLDLPVERAVAPGLHLKPRPLGPAWVFPARNEYSRRR